MRCKDLSPPAMSERDNMFPRLAQLGDKKIFPFNSNKNIGVPIVNSVGLVRDHYFVSYGYIFSIMVFIVRKEKIIVTYRQLSS